MVASNETPCYCSKLRRQRSTLLFYKNLADMGPGWPLPTTGPHWPFNLLAAQ